MAKIELTGADKTGNRQVFVNGIPLPDVAEISLCVRPGCRDAVVMTILADSFQSRQQEEEVISPAQEE